MTNENQAENTAQIKELLEAVKVMRNIQKSYFRIRNFETLCKAKNSETIVDRLLTKIEQVESSHPKLIED
ncbi:MAG: hypothetical protein WC865_14635 [Bacteroidales bacterium]